MSRARDNADLGDNYGTLGSTVVFPAGHVIQTAVTSYQRTSSLSIGTTESQYFGSDFQVTITPKSTSNKLIISCFIPDGYNNATANRGLHGGFKYDADFSSGNGTSLGGREFVADHHGYFGASTALLNSFSYSATQVAPVDSQIIIRPWLKAVTGAYLVFTNSSTSNFGVGFLMVQEIQG
tara:strand:+ start:1509 stop:2048 length:540 start_codon:yes stop_codon:yes gene_type:complete